ncbi:aminopeptidase N [Algoriphagus boseongensis]|uniref:Aminopeptidase N n=1 Tax=Algoriphagus boseongensis TaxID=1442587 RepID=A0A4R6T6H2_9BACT|nr:M1 family aminopeptidase [Algoriphagus boseongensis]TDQ16270.1 aminopeptidase N [Algoriphagus boseongensis]
MKYSFILFTFFLGLASCKQPVSDAHFYDPGISIELAEYRSQQVKNIHYQLDFSIPEKKSDPIPARLILDLEVMNLDHPLILDFNESSEKVLSVAINGSEIPVRHEEEHLIIAKENLIKGENKIDISFIAGDLSLNRNDEFLYTLLVPDRASTLFPCFDQPDLKANYSLTISAPKDWKVLAGASLVQKEEKGEFAIHRFAKSDLMSTYLFSFVAGKFQSAKSENGYAQEMLYRETNEEKIQASKGEIFKLHQQAVTFLENYTGYKFPFQKLDFATIPIFQYGGMEHVGAIQYRESTLFLDPSATDSELLSRAKLIGHETAHMWFGDLVTMKWFNDVWMKEVFANFMAGKIANPAFPKINHDLLFLTSLYPGAYAEDRTRGTNPIRQELGNLKNAGSLYGGIIYNKAPIMMRQLETLMGEEAFKKGIQSYIRTLANGNADWNDLVKILDKETEEDLVAWSEVWVNQSSRPIFSEKLKINEEGKISSLVLTQTAEDGTDKVWPQVFDLTLVYENEQKIVPVSIKGKSSEILEVQGMSKPIAILYNSNGLGYGVFPVDSNYISEFPKIEDELSRASAYLNLYENTLNGTIKPSQNITVLKQGLASESNEIVVQLMAGQLESLFWKFLSKEKREAELQSLEPFIWDLLQKEQSANVKKNLFNLYQSIAYSNEGIERLYQIWTKKMEIANLKLSADNFTSLAMDLALYGHPKAEEILEEERTRITNSDRRDRFDFLVPALSEDASVRDSLFISFKSPEMREKESWVLAACGFIHHPLRQEESLKHVELSLALMEEIQRTGDIFFPKGWASNTVGQYTAPEALELVESFLKSKPDYNPVLKNKILQATDNLYRAQKIMEK